MSLFPMFLRLEGRRCLVVGAGSVAAAKIERLLEAGSDVFVVAPRTKPPIDDWIRGGKVSWKQRGFQPSDLDDVFLVVGATSSSVVHERIFQEAKRRGILCNIVDDPPRCDFHFPAVVRRGDLQIAISTAGQSPALATRLRRELEGQFGPEYKAWVAQLGELRRRLFARSIAPERRRRLLHRLASRQAFERFLRRRAIVDVSADAADPRRSRRQPVAG